MRKVRQVGLDLYSFDSAERAYYIFFGSAGPTMVVILDSESMLSSIQASGINDD